MAKRFKNRVYVPYEMPKLFDKDAEHYYHWSGDYIGKFQDKRVAEWMKLMKGCKKDIRTAVWQDGVYTVEFNNGQVMRVKWDLPVEKIPVMYLV